MLLGLNIRDYCSLASSTAVFSKRMHTMFALAHYVAQATPILRLRGVAYPHKPRRINRFTLYFKMPDSQLLTTQLKPDLRYGILALCTTYVFRVSLT